MLGENLRLNRHLRWSPCEWTHELLLNRYGNRLFTEDWSYNLWDSFYSLAMDNAGNLTPSRASNAQQYPGGAFYRVTHTQVRDAHAALFELGALYMTITVHDGWDKPGPTTVRIAFEQENDPVIADLPVIARHQHGAKDEVSHQERHAAGVRVRHAVRDA